MFTSEQQKRIIEQLLLSFKFFGVEHALCYLAGLLVSHFDIKRLNLFQYTYETKAFLRLAIFDINKKVINGEVPVTVSDIPIVYPRPTEDMYYKQPVISRLITLEDIKIFDSDIGSLYDSGYVARIPLYFSEAFSLFLACYTDSRTLLSLEELNAIMEITQEFGENLAEKILTTEIVSHEGKFLLFSSLEVLEFCSGLNLVKKHVNIVADSKATVLITGETGSGKEVVVEAIHELSPRKNKSLVKVNCGSLPESIIDSLLFGHEKGSFTGAYSTQLGYFEQANGGTIFLDEIGELPLLSQSHLLRVLDRKEVQRLGSSKTIQVDVRILAASNKDLIKLVAEGKFREDLWYRLCSYVIEVPPLRKRKVDIITLSNYYLKIKAKELGLDFLPKLTEENIQGLLAHQWHGNVRELILVIEKALLVLRNKNKNGAKVNNLFFQFQEIKTVSLETNLLKNEILTLEKVYAKQIESALKISNGQVFGENGAAKLLGVHPNTLRNYIKKQKNSSISKEK